MTGELMVFGWGEHSMQADKDGLQITVRQLKPRDGGLASGRVLATVAGALPDSCDDLDWTGSGDEEWTVRLTTESEADAAWIALATALAMESVGIERSRA